MFDVNDLIKYKIPESPVGVYGIITDVLEIKSSANSLNNGKTLYRVKSITCSMAHSEIYEEDILEAYKPYFNKEKGDDKNV